MIDWKNTEKGELPNDNEKVVIVDDFYGDIYTAYFCKGITKEERKVLEEKNDRRARIFRGCDQWNNNSKPWCWDLVNGPNQWFGQEVHLWARLNEFF